MGGQVWGQSIAGVAESGLWVGLVLEEELGQGDRLETYGKIRE